MNKISNNPAKAKTFQWSKLAGKLNKGAKVKSDSSPWAGKLSQRKVSSRQSERKDSSSSSDQESTTNITSRQKQLLKSAAVPGVTYSKSKIGRVPDFLDNRRRLLKSACQIDLTRSGSNSSLTGTEKDQPTSALSKEWPSTAYNRKKKETIKGDWNGSAGSRESQHLDFNRDSAGSGRKRESGANLLVEAIRFGRKRHIKLLLDGGTDPNVQDHEGVTPLIAVVADVSDTGSCSRLMKLLFDAGADPNVPDFTGTTPLMHSAQNNCYEAAVKLLQHEKTDPGIQNNEGYSALMLASCLGFTNIVLLILASFKKVHQITYLGQRNFEGLTAQDLAAKNGHTDIYHFLSSETPFVGQTRLSEFIPAAHNLSRSPTPTDSPSDLETSEDGSYPDLIDKSVRVTTPVSDIELLDSLSLSYDSHKYRFLNCEENSSSESACTDVKGNEGDIESLMDDETPMGNVPTAGGSQGESADMEYPEAKNLFLYRGISEVVSPSISPEVTSEEFTNHLNQMKGFPLPEEEQRTREELSASPELIYDQTNNKNIEEMRNPSFSVDMMGNVSPSVSPEVNSQLPLRSLNEGRTSAFPKRFQEISPSMSPDMGFQPPLKVLHSSGNPLMDRGSLERFREGNSNPLVDRSGLERVREGNSNPLVDRSSLERVREGNSNPLVDRGGLERVGREGNSNQIPVPPYRKEGQPTLNPLVKITLPSPLKTIPSKLNDGMPKLEGGLPSKTLNKSVKNLINEDFEMRPGYRPPTPARPSLPTLLGGKSESSQDSSVSSSSEALPKSRRVTLAGFPRSTAESKTALISQLQKSPQEEDLIPDMLNSSTKSEGWDVLWGHRGRSSVFHSEGHVVPLPPIGQTVGGNVNEMSSQNNNDNQSVLSVAKKTLERLENALSPSEKLNKKKPLPRSRTVHQLNASP